MLAAVAALALAGAALAVLQLASGPGPAGVVVEPPRAGAWEVATAFGPVAVERVERVAGPAHAAHVDVTGAVERQDELRVSLAVENRLGRPVPYSPGQLRLRHEGAGTTSSAIDPRRGAQVLAPGRTVRQEIAFLVPRRRTRFALVVDDLVALRPPAIALGTVPGP